MLVLCVGTILLSMVLTPSDHALHLFGREIPSLCVFHNLTGHDCPGCGLTRSFTYMGHGRPLDAFHMHWLGPVLWSACLFQVPWRLRLLWRSRSPVPPAAPAASAASASSTSPTSPSSPTAPPPGPPSDVG